jgi:hypothetical protein
VGGEGEIERERERERERQRQRQRQREREREREFPTITCVKLVSLGPLTTQQGKANIISLLGFASNASQIGITLCPKAR